MFEKTAFGRKIGGTDHQQKFAYFLLKNNDQGNQPDVHETAHHAADHFHLEQFGKLPQGPNNHDPNKDIDGNGALDQFVNVIEQCGHKDNVDDIGNLELEKI